MSLLGQFNNQQKANIQNSKRSQQNPFLTGQEDAQSLQKSNLGTKNIHKISDSTLRFKLLIETLKRKKCSQNPQINQNIKDQLLSNAEVINLKCFNENKIQNPKQLTQREINEEKLQSKRNRTRNNYIDQTKKFTTNCNKMYILNPQFINKVQINHHCTSLRESRSQRVQNQYPTITTTESNFSKFSKQNQFQNKLNKEIRTVKKIKNIDQNSVKNYLKQAFTLSHISTPSDIFNFFNNLSTSHQIQISNPFIKKYKNCIFYGTSHQQNQKYEGYLLYYQGKIYYGQFLNEHKHGHGVQIDIQNNKIWKGQFKKGKKTGKFYFKSQLEEYIGYMQNSVYQGEGKLKTNDSIFQGFFNLGLKHGYGEQNFFKTGLCIKGLYQHNNFKKAQIGKIKINSLPQFKKMDKINQNSTQRFLNKKLKEKLKLIINQDPKLYDSKIINDLKVSKNIKNFYSKKMNRQYLSERKNTRKQAQTEELELQNIYLQKQKFRKTLKQTCKEIKMERSKQKMTEQKNKQIKKSQLSIMSHGYQEQTPLPSYFYPLNY